MSTENDVARSLRSWLREERHEDADRVLDAVFDQVPATPQRSASWLARRFPPMNSKLLRIGIVAAGVVLLVAFIGFQLMGRSSVGGPESSPSPSASPTVAASASPVAEFPAAGPMEVGRHSITLGGVRLSLEIPSTGWISNGDFGIDKGDQEAPDSAGFIFWTLSAPDNVYADPCTRTQLDPAAGTSAAQLAAAVSRIPGIELIEAPTRVTVDGVPAQKVVVRIPDDIACAANDFYLWYDEANDSQARYATAVGSTITAWIIDANGGIVWIDAETYENSSQDAVREIQQIIDSIRFAQGSGPG